MNKRDEQDRINFETKERFALREFYEKYIRNNYPAYNTQVTFTPIDNNGKKSDSYDGTIYLRNKETNRIEIKFLVEVKVRLKNYETLMLELLKYNLMLKHKKESLSIAGPGEEVALIYLCVMPEATYLFQLCSDKVFNYLDDRRNMVVRDLPKTTYKSGDRNIDKNVFLLPKSFARKYDYIFSYDRYQASLVKPQPKQLAPGPIQITRTASIF